MIISKLTKVPTSIIMVIISMTIAGIVINVPFRMIITIMIMITMMIQSDTANNTNIDNYTSNDVKKYDE